MKSKIAVLAVLGTLAGVSAQAQVYDNGPINGTILGWTINFGYQVSDSFAVGSATSLGSAQVGIWNIPGDAMTGVSWEIGTTPFGDDISSGTTPVGFTSLGDNAFGYLLSEDTFPISGSVVPGTTYYFTLLNASTPGGDPAYWDENLGPSTAYENTLGELNGDGSGDGSESFQLYGASGGSNSVPDGGVTGMLLGSGLSVLAFLKRKLS
jgi:hypothetical protein